MTVTPVFVMPAIVMPMLAMLMSVMLMSVMFMAVMFMAVMLMAMMMVSTARKCAIPASDERLGTVLIGYAQTLQQVSDHGIGRRQDRVGEEPHRAMKITELEADNSPLERTCGRQTEQVLGRRAHHDRDIAVDCEYITVAQL
jgi:hypothetical protein